MTQKNKQHQIFNQLLERVGGWNRYQFYLFFMLSLIFMIQMGFIFLTPFLFYQNQYKCEDNSSEQCNNYVCQLPIDQRDKYLEPTNIQSLADTLGDFRCEYKQFLPMIQCGIYITIISGMIIFSFFSQSIGRKKSLIITSGLILVGLIILIFSSTIWMTMFAIFLTILGTQLCNSVANCLSMEIVSESKRVTYSNSLRFMYAIGFIMNGTGFMILKNWKLVIGMFYIVPALLIVLSIIILLQKTPLDLLKNEKPQEIMNVLQKIQNINKIQESRLSLSYITQLKIKYYYLSTFKHQSSFSIKDLFYYKSILKIMIPLLVFSFQIIYMYSAPAMINPTSNMDDLVNGNVVSGISFAISVVLVQVMARNLKRRLSFLVLLIIGITMILMELNIDLDHNNSLKNALNLIERMMICAVFVMFSLVLLQSFPTQIRSVAYLFIISCGFIADIITPWIIQYCNKNQIDMKYTYLTAYLLAIISALFVKETYMMESEDVIEELQYVKGQIKIDQLIFEKQLQEPDTPKTNYEDEKKERKFFVKDKK